MSGNPVTNADLMRRLVDIEQGLTARLDDHDRRLDLLEPAAGTLRDVLDCNAQIVKELVAMRKLQETAMDEVSKRVEHSLRADVLSLRHELRGDIARLCDSTEALTTALQSRPCFKGNGDCAVLEEDNA